MLARTFLPQGSAIIPHIFKEPDNTKACTSGRRNITLLDQLADTLDFNVLDCGLFSPIQYLQTRVTASIIEEHINAASDAFD